MNYSGEAAEQVVRVTLNGIEIAANSIHGYLRLERMAEYFQKYPDLCRLTASTNEGSETYEIDKARISIRLTAPYSEERKKAAGERAKQLNADKSSPG